MPQPSDFPGSPASPRLLRERYRIDRRIARGGMGVVYEGVDLALERPVAVKVIDRDPGDEGLAQRFVREVKIAAKIRHEHIVEVFDVGEEDGLLYFVMELLDGASLAKRLDGGARLAPAEAAHVGAQISDALEAAHQAGVIHRDLKPANVMLLRRGKDEAFVKLIDFGIAKSVDTHAPTRTGEVLGTIGYMAPEQILGEPIDARTDLYALGVLLYRALAGAPVFPDHGVPAAIHDHLETPPIPLRERAPAAGIPAALDELVLRCLAKRPGDRFASAAEVGDALRALASSAPVFELVYLGAPVPPDAPPSSAPAPAGAALAPANDDAAEALTFELAEVAAPALPRPSASLLCASCRHDNMRYAQLCAGCGADLATPEQATFRARVEEDRQNGVALVPLPALPPLARRAPPVVPGLGEQLATMPPSSAGRLVGGSVLLVLLGNAMLQGFGPVSSVMLVAGALVASRLLLGSRRRPR